MAGSWMIFMFVLFLCFSLRCYSILPFRLKTRGQNVKQIQKKRKGNCKTMIVLGSGGHTAEMFQLISAISPIYSPRHYIVAKTDQMSEKKAISFEESQDPKAKFQITKIPRSREVGQSWITSFFSTVYATIFSFKIVLLDIPDVILCNGPGTCIPICFISYVIKFFGLRNIKIIFIESFARVQTLSLSGKILYYFADRFLVQWPELRTKYPMSEYLPLQ